jgi:ppGpp synthetase/RelA/SpoT-type nucleotidyltranferase
MSKKIKKKNAPMTISLQALEQEYRAATGLVDGFCVELKSQMDRLLDDQGITLGFPIQYRVKQWESIAAKLDRLSLNISSIKDVQDIAGLRLILLFKRDVEKVCRLLTESFKVIRQYDTQERLAEDQFGYSSIHFIIELPEDWLAVPTLSRFRGLIAEVQVRTLAQHIWAAASHTLQYKQTEGIPPSVRRAIHRASALLETIDLEFERVLEQRELYIANVDISATEEYLNVDLLEKALDSLLPPSNKRANESYDQLLRELSYFGIQTPQQLNELIEKQLPNILADESEMVITRRRKEGVFYMHTGLVRRALRHEFGAGFDHESIKKYALGRPPDQR